MKKFLIYPLILCFNNILAQNVANVSNFYISVFEPPRISVTWDAYVASPKDSLVVMVGLAANSYEYGIFKFLVYPNQSARLILPNQINTNQPVVLTYYVKLENGSKSPSYNQVYNGPLSVTPSTISSSNLNISSIYGTDIAVVNYNLSTPGELSISLYNNSGNNMGEVFKGNVSGKNSINITMSNYPSGMYLARCFISNQVITIKIVK